MTGSLFGARRPQAIEVIADWHKGACYFKALKFPQTGQTIHRGQEFFGKVIKRSGKSNLCEVDIGLPIPGQLVADSYGMLYEGNEVPVQIVYLRRKGMEFQIGLQCVRLNNDYSTELFRSWCLKNGRQVKFLEAGKRTIDYGYGRFLLEYDPPAERGPLRTYGRPRFLTGSDMGRLNAGESIQIVGLEVSLFCHGDFSVNFFAVLPHLLQAVRDEKVFTALNAKEGFDAENRKPHWNWSKERMLIINGGRISGEVDYDAVGVLFVPQDQLESTVAKVTSGNFKFKLVMEDLTLREGGEEQTLAQALNNNPFLAVES